MNKKRLEAYRNLIDALLNSNEGEEWELLQAHRELLDSDFIQVMEEVAQELKEKGNQERADFLVYLAEALVYQGIIAQLLNCASVDEALQILDANRDWVDAGLQQMMLAVAEDLRNQGDLDKSNFLMNIVEQLMEVHEHTSDAQRNFLLRVLQTTAESGGDAQKVYPLLEANIDKLDDRLAQLLQSWATSRLGEALLDEAKTIANSIGNFSNLIQKYTLGNKASNIEIAITGYEIVLKVYTREAFPHLWAMTLNDLGIAYFYRIRGDKAENLEQAISCSKQALTKITLDALPQQWAIIQRCLGLAYLNRIRGDKSENLEQAIACFQQALTVTILDSFPQLWAYIQILLARTYTQRIRGNKADNLEQAIACLQLALTVITLDFFPQIWAETQNILGLAYLDRIRGEKAENIEQAITCFKQALSVRSLEDFPFDWATTQNNLGLAYFYRIKGAKAENLEQAIACCQQALTIKTLEAFPVDWATTQNVLGLAYFDRIRGNKAENLEQAITCFQQVLTIKTLEAFPVDWAITQNYLGLAYTNRIRGDKAENLERAIACFQQALTVRTLEAFPFDWAGIQHNLAIAYCERIRGDKAENLERAIACSQEALTVRTLEAFPIYWATTQNTFGIIYLHRIRGDKAENLEQAITCFQQALTVYTFDAFSFDWANTQNNLGLAYTNRIRGDKAENLERAITCFQQALTVRTLEAFPVDWANTQNNLGLAYTNRIRGDKSANLEQAISCFQQALTVRTLEAFPQKHAESLGRMAYAYFDTNQLFLAYNTFVFSIDSVELLREKIVSGEESRRKQAESFNPLYGRMVKVCLELGKVIEAIEYVERSKTRNLVEQILERNLKTIFPPEVVTQLEKYRDEIATGQYQIQHGKAKNSKALAQHLQQLRKQRNELQDHYLPIGSGFQFEHFQKTLDDRTAIVEFYITGDKLLTFIFTHLTQQPIVFASAPKDLDKLEKWVYGYFRAYDNKPYHWQHRLNTRLHLLAQILHIDEIIKQIPPECDRLIFIPHQDLHLFPLHALPINSQKGKAKSEILMHRFPAGVSYAPSCQILELTQTRKRLEFQRLFAIVNPTPDLYEKYEADLGAVKAIGQQFDNKLILKKDKAKKSEILHFDEKTKTVKENEELLGANCLFFFCHGYFNPVSPLDSGLQLADDDLTLVDIIAHFNLENCRLVTLSACETGMTDFTQISDEYIGLPYGFLLAGSTNVISSLWTVSAAATALLMIKFYEELQQQNNITVALNTAQAWLRDTTSQGFQNWLKNSSLSLVWQRELKQYFAKNYSETTKPFESPFYWSAFFVAGKGV